MSSHKICCKKCGCQDICRAGKSRVLNQRYRCKRCNHRFVEHDGRLAEEKWKKRVAIFFTYHELGISTKKISTILKLKEKTVKRWIETEEKAFQDNDYRNKMVFCRSKNYYYHAIRELLEVDKGYDENWTYDNGNETEKVEVKEEKIEVKEEKIEENTHTHPDWLSAEYKEHGIQRIPFIELNESEIERILLKYRDHPQLFLCRNGCRYEIFIDDNGDGNCYVKLVRRDGSEWCG